MHYSSSRTFLNGNTDVYVKQLCFDQSYFVNDKRENSNLSQFFKLFIYFTLFLIVYLFSTKTSL